MSKRLQKNKGNDASHLVYMDDYYQGDFDKKTTEDHEFYINIGLLPTDTFDLLSYLSGLKPGHIKDLKEMLSYRCPYSGNTYYGAFPVAYLATEMPDLPPYKSQTEQIIFENTHEFRDGEDSYGINHIGEIGRSLLGHGYKVESISIDIMDLGLCDIETHVNKDEKIIFKTWKRLSLDQ